MEKKEKPGKESYDHWHDDPSNWRGGIFYYNKKDKRLFPPKRFRSFGWTVNFASPYSFLTLLVIIILILVVVIYGK
jgi:uncharacterized membrane protein